MPNQSATVPGRWLLNMAESAANGANGTNSANNGNSADEAERVSTKWEPDGGH